MRKIKRCFIKASNFYRCVRYKAPYNCLIGRKVKIRNVKFGGKNKVDSNAKIISSEIGFGTFVAKETEISNCKIGKYSLIGFKGLVGSHPLHKIVSIHPAFYSTRGQFGFSYVKNTSYEEFRYADKKNEWCIVIGNDVWATGECKIVHGINVADGAVILGGAIVTKDVPPYAIVAGIPAKIIGYRFDEDEIEFLNNLKWWDKGEDWIYKHREYFADVKTLMQVLQRNKQLLHYKGKI